jgi:hypothetical protein
MHEKRLLGLHATVIVNIRALMMMAVTDVLLIGW